MSDTPETDQVEKYDGFKIKDSVTTCGDESSSVYINVIHARQLERERDKARESLKHITEYGTEEINAAVELRQKLATALVERDEAREKAERYRLEANSLMLQRDELRDKYDTLATEHMLVVNKLCEERDDAREQINRYRYNLDLLPIKWDI